MLILFLIIERRKKHGEWKRCNDDNTDGGIRIQNESLLYFFSNGCLDTLLLTELCFFLKKSESLLLLIYLLFLLSFHFFSLPLPSYHLSQLTYQVPLFNADDDDQSSNAASFFSIFSLGPTLCLGQVSPECMAKKCRLTFVLLPKSRCSIYRSRSLHTYAAVSASLFGAWSTDMPM